jgi:hypothetical protein
MNRTNSSFRRIFASSLFVVAAAGVLFATSTAPRAHAETAQPRANEAGVWLIITHKVENYKLWKPVHDRSVGTKRNYGWSKCAVFAIDGDKNHIMVMEQFASLDRAKAYAESNELRDEMAASGVSSNPEVRFVKNLNGELAP